MPSREIRRANQKKTAEKAPSGDEKKKKKSFLYIFSLILLVLIIVTFIGVPVIGNAGRSQGRVIFGTFAGKSIEFIYGNFFSNQVNSLAAQLQDSQRDEANILSQTYQIWREAFNRTVVHLGMLSEMETADLHISKDKVADAIIVNGPYMDNGEFSEALYRQSSNLEKENTRKQFSETLRAQQYREDLFLNLQYSSNEINFIKSMGTAERKFTYVSWAYADFPIDQVIAYGEENAKLFTRIKVSRIAIRSGEADTKRILEQINLDTGRFEDLARNQSVDTYAEQGGDMGYRMYYELQTDFTSQDDLDALFALSPGDVSGVVAGPSMWFIYRCDEAPVRPNLSDEAMQKTVRTYMERFEAGKIEDYLTEKARELKEKADAGADFDEAAAALDREVFATDYFPVNYGGSFFFSQVRSLSENTALSGAAYNERFFLSAFGLKENEVSEPLILGSNVVTLRFVEEREAPDENLEQLEFYYPYIVQQFREEDMSKYFLSSPKLEDKFNEKFSEMFVNNQ